MILRGDCIERMAEMDADSIDAIVCDPPYGLEFMGRDWDRLEAKGRGAKVRDRRAAEMTPNGQGHSTSKGPYLAAGVDWQGVNQSAMQEWHHAWATEAIRILKPGGHLLAFGGTRTYHRLACAAEDAGFEIRDSLIWLYGSGFPKSLDVSKAIDKAAGAEREVVGPSQRHVSGKPEQRTEGLNGSSTFAETVGMGSEITAPATPEAAQWQGWGTALKPAHEPIVVARKPLAGTVAANVLEHGTGALNVDGCRVGANGGNRREGNVTHESRGAAMGDYVAPATPIDGLGRWPANVALSHLPGCEQVGTRRVKNQGGVPNGDSEKASRPTFTSDDRTSTVHHFDPDGTETIPAYSCAPGCPVAELDRQSGERGASGKASGPTHDGPSTRDTMSGDFNGMGDREPAFYGDTGGASRFFYVAKASRAERNAGLGGFEEQTIKRFAGGEFEHNNGRNATKSARDMRNVHPTVKPIALMRWLVRLVTPPGGTVLDPFTGSGTTGAAAVLEGFDFIGIEREAEYAAIAEARVAFWKRWPGADVDAVLASELPDLEDAGQLGLLTITEEE